MGNQILKNGFIRKSLIAAVVIGLAVMLASILPSPDLRAAGITPGGSITINGTTCVLNGSCSITAGASLLFSQVTNVDVTNSAAELTMNSATGAQGSLTLAANYFGTAGNVMRFDCGGLYTGSGAIGLTLKVKLGTTVIATNAVTPNNTANSSWRWTGNIISLTTGTTGTVWSNNFLEYNGPMATNGSGSQAPVTINTTLSQAFSLTAQWASANPGVHWQTQTCATSSI